MNPATKKSWGMMQHINSDMLAALIHPDKTLLVVLEFWLFKESVDDAEAVEDLRKQNLIGELRQISTDEFLTELHEESYNLEFTDTKIKVKDEKIMRAHSYLLAGDLLIHQNMSFLELRKLTPIYTFHLLRFSSLQEVSRYNAERGPKGTGQRVRTYTGHIRKDNEGYYLPHLSCLLD